MFHGNMFYNVGDTKCFTEIISAIQDKGREVKTKEILG